MDNTESAEALKIITIEEIATIELGNFTFIIIEEEIEESCVI